MPGRNAVIAAERPFGLIPEVLDAVDVVWREAASGPLPGQAPGILYSHVHRFAAVEIKAARLRVRNLTEPGDIVLDIFAGSNTTGQVAEAEDRPWLAFELSRDYTATSAFRFMSKANTHDEMRQLYDRIEGGETVDLNEYVLQRRLLPAAS